MVIWILGLSGSGKSYLSLKIKEKYKNRNFIILDGDEIRKIFNNDLGHSLNDRKINAFRISKLAHFLSNKNINLIVPVLSIFPNWLKWNRKNIKDYFEIFIDVNINILKKRNNKNIYLNKKKKLTKMLLE